MSRKRSCEKHFLIISNYKRKEFYLFILKILFIYFREGEGGRKRGRKTSMCSCLSCTPWWGPGLQPGHAARLGIEPVTLWFTGQHSIHWAIPARTARLFPEEFIHSVLVYKYFTIDPYILAIFSVLFYCLFLVVRILGSSLVTLVCSS